MVPLVWFTKHFGLIIW